MKCLSYFFAALIASMLAACSNALPTVSPTVSPRASAQPSVLTTGVPSPATTYPVTIENCGRTLTFTKAPERVVALYSTVTELLLALGLKSRIIAAGYTQSEPLLPEYQADYAQLTSLSTTTGPTKESLIIARPDFVIDNDSTYFYDAAQGFATKDDLKAAGAQTYTLTTRCPGAETNATIDSIAVDIRNMGVIFGVQARAEALVQQLQQRIAATQQRIAGTTPLRVLIFDSGEGPYNVYGPGVISSVVATAGGQNIFATLDKEYTAVSAEQIAAANPQVFVIPEYGPAYTGAPSAKERGAALVKTFATTDAGKHNHVVIIPYQNINASIQNAIGVETLAKALHPEVFEITPNTTAQPVAATYPITIENCGRTLTFTKAPERVLATWQSGAEMMAALGLADKVVGVNGRRLAAQPPAEIATALDTMNFLIKPGERPAPKEVVIALRPDFVLAAYFSSDLDSSAGLASVDDFAQIGSKVYGMSSECTGADQATIESTYQDMLTIGRIFGVEPRAKAVVQAMKDQISDIQKRIAGRTPVRVAVYDSGEGPLGFYASGMYGDLVRLAGGVSVFADQKVNYAEVSAEAIAASNTEFFIIDDYEVASPKADARARYLFTTFPQLPASKNKRWAAIEDIQFVSGIRNASAVVDMAKALYPEVFK